MRRTSKICKVGPLVDATLKSLGLANKIMEQKAVANWGKVVGPQIMGATCVERVRDGLMYVSCRSGVWANELVVHKEDIMRRLNKSVGGNVIKDIKFSGRGYKKCINKYDDEAIEEIKLDKIELKPSDKKAAEKAAAFCSDKDLAELVKRATITSMKMAKLRESEIRGVKDE